MRDTIITTAQGARLSIPAGALGDSTGKVRIEVKEAYTIADIIKGRLVTTSKGMPLSSGGMIYINVAGRGDVKLRKPIKVAIPSKGLQEGMQVFRGQKNDNGEIDWVDPRPLLKTKVDSDLAIGKTLFMTKCGSCHGVGKAITGPDLAWIAEREQDKKWLHAYIHNNYGMLEHADRYACYLYNLYNKKPMEIFPALSDGEIDWILNYIGNASQTIDSTTVPNYRRSFDSCMRYTLLRDSLVKKLDAEKIRRSQLTTANGPEVLDKRYVPSNAIPPVPKTLSNTGVVMHQRTSSYYQFEIDATGWFNIDILFKDLPGVEESELRVQVKGEHVLQANVYLVIPSLKALVPAGTLPGKNDVYGFFTADGKVPLPQGVPAIILCMGEDGGQPFWGKVQWMTSRSQELSVEPTTMSKEEINTAITQLHFEDLSITVKDAKNAGEVRQLDSATRTTDSLLRTIAGLKPRFCDCDCHFGFAEGDSGAMRLDTVMAAPPVQAK